MKRIIFFSNYVEFILFLHCVDLHYLLKSRVQNDMNYNNVSVFCTVILGYYIFFRKQTYADWYLYVLLILLMTVYSTLSYFL